MIPRSGPGTYEMTNYLAFVENVNGLQSSKKIIPGVKGRGSFFVFEDEGGWLEKITYKVDIEKMESQLLGGFASSKLRDNYLGILGNSVFGFVEGLENHPILLDIEMPEHWPVFSTLNPELNRNKQFQSYKVHNFSELADAQFLMGNDVQLHQVPDSPIPLFVAVYAETEVDLVEIGRRGLLALNGLADYFGYIPMPHYTMCYEFLIPYSEQHDYGFSMEHLNSMTASMDTSRAITGFRQNPRIGSIVHHIGHSWLPLRSYGTGYRPFEWQTAPLIETIWLNEGFIWYIAFYHVLGNKNILNFFNRVIKTAPPYIQEKSLKELSLLGSTQYSLDFRIGRNLFSRGALLAHDLDNEIQTKTSQQKSFKEAILGLLHWSEKNKRAFEYSEIEPIMSRAVGIDLSSVWEKWQGPLSK